MIAAIIHTVLLLNLIVMAFSPSVEDAAHTPNPISPHAQLEIAETIFSTTGVFSVPLPEGDWFVFDNVYDPVFKRAVITLASPEELAIAQSFMFFDLNPDDLQELNDEYYTDIFFNLEWSTDYERAEIVRRKIDENFLTIDFDLISDGEKYAGRQISWLDEGHVFNIRLVVPLLHIRLVGELQTLLLGKMAFYPNMLGTPLEDMQIVTRDDLDIMVKLPDDWQQFTPPDDFFFGLRGPG